MPEPDNVLAREVPHRPMEWPAPAGARFESMEAMYDAAPDEVRRWSCEVDFGVWWTEGEATWPRYRVTWIERSRELVAVQLGGDAGAYVPGIGIALTAGRASSVEVLGVTDDPDRALAGWPEQCGGPHGLAWVRARVAS